MQRFLKLPRYKKIYVIFAFTMAFFIALIVGILVQIQLESRIKRLTENAIPVRDLAWVIGEYDGLIVTLKGQAPDEQAMFRVLESVGKAVNARNIVNEISPPEQPPQFDDVRVEIIKTPNSSSIIGLLPREPSPLPLYNAVARDSTGEVLNLVQEVSLDDRQKWGDEVGIMVEILKSLEQVKISAQSGQVFVSSLAKTQEEGQDLRKTLENLSTDHVQVVAKIASPRLMITPFTFDLVKENGQYHVESCALSDEDDRKPIQNALKGADAAILSNCQFGLGAPTADWGLVLAQFLRNLDELESYELHIHDSDVKIVYSDKVDEGKAEQAIARISGALPPGFSLETEQKITYLTAEELAQNGASESLKFSLSKEGEVIIQGPLANDAAKASLSSYSAAKLPNAQILLDVVLVQDLPLEWESYSIAAISILSEMIEGVLDYSKDHLNISGKAASEEHLQAIDEIIASNFSDFTIQKEIVIEEQPAIPESKDPVLCVDEIGSLLRAQPIQFDPGSTHISEVSLSTIEAMGKILSSCQEYAFEIGGHTDSQGSEEANLRISDGRANAVLLKLLEQDQAMGELISKGYGESLPIADNNTEEGRAQNRRIELRLIEQ